MLKALAAHALAAQADLSPRDAWTLAQAHHRVLASTSKPYRRPPRRLNLLFSDRLWTHLRLQGVSATDDLKLLPEATVKALQVCTLPCLQDLKLLPEATVKALQVRTHAPPAITVAPVKLGQR